MTSIENSQIHSNPLNYKWNNYSFEQQSLLGALQALSAFTNRANTIFQDLDYEIKTIDGRISLLSENVHHDLKNTVLSLKSSSSAFANSGTGSEYGSGGNAHHKRNSKVKNFQDLLNYRHDAQLNFLQKQRDIVLNLKEHSIWNHAYQSAMNVPDLTSIPSEYSAPKRYSDPEAPIYHWIQEETLRKRKELLKLRRERKNNTLLRNTQPIHMINTEMKHEKLQSSINKNTVRFTNSNLDSSTNVSHQVDSNSILSSNMNLIGTEIDYSSSNHIQSPYPSPIRTGNLDYQDEPNAMKHTRSPLTMNVSTLNSQKIDDLHQQQTIISNSIGNSHKSMYSSELLYIDVDSSDSNEEIDHNSINNGANGDISPLPPIPPKPTLQISSDMDSVPPPPPISPNLLTISVPNHHRKNSSNISTTILHHLRTGSYNLKKSSPRSNEEKLNSPKLPAESIFDQIRNFKKEGLKNVNIAPKAIIQEEKQAAYSVADILRINILPILEDGNSDESEEEDSELDSW